MKELPLDLEYRSKQLNYSSKIKMKNTIGTVCIDLILVLRISLMCTLFITRLDITIWVVWIKTYFEGISNIAENAY